MIEYLRDQPEGTYESDEFFERFTPKVLAENLAQLSPEELEDWRERHFKLYRFDVERVVRVAYLRAQRENEIEPARRQANELLEILAHFPPELARLEQFSVDAIHQIAKVLRSKDGELPLNDPKAILIQVLDLLRAPMSTEQLLAAARAQFPTMPIRIDGFVQLARRPSLPRDHYSYLMQWLEELGRYEVIPRLAPRRLPLQGHLITQAIALHQRRLSAPPPGARQHWLGGFVAALWVDIGQAHPRSVRRPGQPHSRAVLDLEDYFGRKIEKAIRGGV
jgi:hypothetical protein